MKVGGIIKVEVSNANINITENGPKGLLERDLTDLQNIGGYTVDKFHNNFRNQKYWRDIELHQATSFIGAYRTTKPCENQTKHCHIKRRAVIY